MPFIDTHCHIHEATTEQAGDEMVRSKWAQAGLTDPQKIIADAVNADVTKLICVGCTLRDSKLAVELVATSEHCVASIGIHPHEAKDHVSPHVMRDFTKLVNQPKVVAIGECGLDYYYSHSSKADQEKILRFQLELAVEHDLPVIFHVRDAFEDFWPIFDQYPGIKGVIHSFTAKQAELEQILNRDLYVGLNGIVTFTKDLQQLDAVKMVPLNRMVLETDAPFLTPSPFRGTICKPEHVVRTAEFLSDMRGRSLEDIAAITTDNAHKLFNL